MARFAVFMRCLSVAVLKRGVKTLAEAVPFGVVLYDVAADTLAQYFKNHRSG